MYDLNPLRQNQDANPTANAVPAEAISGRMSLETFIGMLAGTAFSVGFASWFWRKGLKSYTGASA